LRRGFLNDIMELLKHFFRKEKLPESGRIVPRHVAIIMDGNGRWAKRRGLPRTAGHKAGMERIRDIVNVCVDQGVKYLTLYAFSTENWKRPQEEVNYLMDLFINSIRKEVRELHERNVRVCFIGLRNELSPELAQVMDESERLTAANTTLTINFAINYGGRSEIIAAINRLIVSANDGKPGPELITEESFASFLFTSGQPDPDLLIRPGGERRISNFLIWQLAYTEIYFSDTFWPDFDKREFLEALAFYGSRERRFGGLKGGLST
jgi:undecaprenyl diphosphate synthase